MVDVAALHAQVLTCLREVTAGSTKPSVYDGNVVDKPPVDSSGRVLPYYVVGGSPGRPPDERGVTDRGDVGLDWTLTVTVAAGTQVWVMGAVGLLRRAVLDLVLPGGARMVEQPRPDGFIQIDRDVSPPRFWVPLQWRALIP